MYACVCVFMCVCLFLCACECVCVCVCVYGCKFASVSKSLNWCKCEDVRVRASISVSQLTCPRRFLLPSGSFNNASDVSRSHCVTPCALERPGKRVLRASPSTSAGGSTNDDGLPRSVGRSLTAGVTMSKGRKETGTALMDDGGAIQRVRRSDTPRPDHARI